MIPKENGRVKVELVKMERFIGKAFQKNTLPNLFQKKMVEVEQKLLIVGV